jgi:hypothetical protein
MPLLRKHMQLALVARTFYAQQLHMRLVALVHYAIQY